MRVTIGLLTFFVAGMFVLQPAGIVQAEDIGITLDDLEDGDAFAVGSPSGVPVDAEGKPLLPEYSSFAGGYEEQGSAEILTFPSLASNCKIPKKDFEQPAGLPDAPRIVTIFDVYQEPPVSTGPEALLDGDYDIVEPNSDGFKWGAGCNGRVRYPKLPKAKLLELVGFLKTAMEQSEPDDAIPANGQTGNTQTGGQNTGQTLPGDPTGSIHQQVGATTEEEPPNGNSGSTGSQTATTTASGSGGSVSSGSSSSAIGQISQEQEETTGEGQQNESSGSTKSQETQTGSPTFIELDPCPKISDEVAANPSVKPDSPLGSSTNQQAAVGQANSDPIPVVWLNGKTILYPLLFVNDQKNFKLVIKNDGIKGEPASQGNAKRQGKCFPKTPATPMTVKIELIWPQRRFLLGIYSQTFTLAPQESHTFVGFPDPYLHKIKLYEQDILFGAKIKITVWPEGESNTKLYEKSFNVYLYLDAADSKHTDGIVAFPKTLADGPKKIIRSRPITNEVPPEAAVRFTFESEKPPGEPREFSVSPKKSPTQFLFDPAKRKERETVEDVVTIRTVALNKFVGKLQMKGTAEPKSKTFFNEKEFREDLKEIAKQAKSKQMATETPPAYSVHTALITPTEVALFDYDLKRKKLITDINDRIETLYGQKLMKGIEWTSEPGENTIILNWERMDNRRSFATGLTNPDDNWSGVKEVIQQKDKWSKAELAYRLAEEINKNLSATIKLWPDSLLENHVNPHGGSKASLKRIQFIWNLAKTLVHEVGHALGLQHVRQIGNVGSLKNEVQKLKMNPTRWYRLKFQGISTDRIWFNLLKNRRPMWEALLKLPTIGYMNWDDNSYGVYVYRCQSVLHPLKPPDEEPPLFIKEQCQAAETATPPEPVEQIFMIEFTAHLSGTNVEPLTIHPAFAGTITTPQEGEATNALKTKNGQNAVIVLDGVTGKTLAEDIMHGGYHDITGKLRFQPGVSLEIMKMALALKYTKADVEKVVKVFTAQVKAYETWGVPGFEDEK